MTNERRAQVWAGVALLLAAASAIAAGPLSYEGVLGRPLGDGITLHHEMRAYLAAVAASPRVKIEGGAYSWEGRELLAAVVTSPGNQERLEEIRANAALLADPRRLTPERAETLIREQPVVIWMGGSIHGFELSGAEGLLKLLERLVTADDVETTEALEDAVIVLDPMLNPDGRDAFAQRNQRTRGRVAVPQRHDWGNDFSRWEALGFRTGHYFFDTNRDWWAQTQVETRARARALSEWRPQVVVDLHEMSSDVEFYFDPASEPYGPFFPPFARRWFSRFGEAYAEAFDRAGFEYMTRERYNYFYPGYTTSYGSYLGAVGMLYEQGSSRGLAITRADDSVRTLADAVEQQYTAAWAAVSTAVAHREELLREAVAAHGAAIDDGRRGPRRYFVGLPGDPGLLADLGELLRRNGIEVGALQTPVRLDSARDRQGRPVKDVSLSAGTLVIEAAQPLSRLIRVLLEPDLPLPPDFLEEARRRIDRGENPRFYDITAWSLPLLYDLAAFSSEAAVAPPTAPATDSPPAPSFPATPPAYAYLLDGAQAASTAALHHLRAAGYRAAMLVEATRVDGRDYPRGTVVLRIGQNGDGLHAELRRLAERHRLRVDGVDTGLSEAGFPALGSADAVPVRAAEVALLAEGSVHAYSFGWAWYLLDRQYEIPVSVLRVGSVAATPLDRFEVLVLPDLFSAEGLADDLGEKGMERLESWVRDGGTLVAIGEGAEFARSQLELIALRSWYDVERGGETAPEPRRFEVPGAIVRARLDPASWLTSGCREELPVLVASSRVLLPPEGPPDANRRVAARYAEADSLRLSGHLWPESGQRLPGAVFLYEERVDRGRVIVFAEDPNFRGYLRGADRLFLNAVVVGPSAP